MAEESSPRVPTPREQEVLEMICEAYPTKQIAHILGISFKTVTIHRHRLLKKAGAHESISLFRWAIQNGYVSTGLTPKHKT
jgi:DNA-binding NarL/FixJ family response regulator